MEYPMLQIFPFSTLSCHSLQAYNISAEKSADSFMRVPLTLFFSCCLQNSLFNFCHFNCAMSFNYGMSWCGSVWVHLFGSLCASCIYISISFFRLGSFSVIISLYTFSPLFLSLLFLDPFIANIGTLDVIQKSLKLVSVF